MARTSQTKLAVLGGLSVEPMTGYALRQAISETLGHFWSESFGQIYPTLAALEADGLVRRAAAGATSGSVFSITDAGLDELRRLLAEPIAAPPPRNGLLLRLFFGRHLGPDEVRRILQESLEDAVAGLSRLQAVSAEVSGEPETSDTPFWRMTISAGEHHARAQIAWLEESMATLDAATDPTD